VGAIVELAAAGAQALFGEGSSRVILSAKPEHLAEIRERARAASIPLAALGQTGGDSLEITVSDVAVVSLPLASLRDARERCLEAIVGS
jgi:hypothetical protein